MVDGICDGNGVLGEKLGVPDGAKLGISDGIEEGWLLGDSEGAPVGDAEGDAVGSNCPLHSPALVQAFIHAVPTSGS